MMCRRLLCNRGGVLASWTATVHVCISCRQAMPNAIDFSQVEVDDEAFATCEAMMERLLELDDVDAVYTNVAGLSN